MQSISPISSSNPLKIIRSLPLIEIPSNLISIRDDIPEDPIFESKYAAFVEGRTNVHHTRMSISCIRKGFWRSHALGFDLVEERVRRDDIEHVKGMIWFGNRPALFIYENPNKGDSFSYVCTDDIPVHAAYEELGYLYGASRTYGKTSKFAGIGCYSKSNSHTWKRAYRADRWDDDGRTKNI